MKHCKRHIRSTSWVYARANCLNERDVCVVLCFLQSKQFVRKCKRWVLTRTWTQWSNSWWVPSSLSYIRFTFLEGQWKVWLFLWYWHWLPVGAPNIESLHLYAVKYTSKWIIILSMCVCRGRDQLWVPVMHWGAVLTWAGFSLFDEGIFYHLILSDKI